MRHQLAMTKNILKFMQAVDELMTRPYGTEGMGLLWGLPGEGKSTAIAFVVNKMDGVFVRAVSCWTVTAMLGELCRELGGERKQRRSDMVEWICKQLAEKPRPIFIDEADYLFRQPEMLESIRDIYDMSGCPVILIGMEDIARKIQSMERIARRVTQWVKFEGIDAKDGRILADTVCEVHVDDDLLAHLHSEAAANIGRMVIGLTRIEKMAQSSGLKKVALDQWGDKPLFYDQPLFSARRKRA